MKCPFCGFAENRVIDSRSSKDDTAVRRRRECANCNQRFTTYEYIEDTPLRVIKRDGRREPFDRQKLLRGISTACGKRPIATDVIENMVDSIENDLKQLDRGEIPSTQVGETVMEKLHQLDEVAYIRFASVYRSFRDTKEFLEELEKLLAVEKSRHNNR